ncbi:MAG: hypothetical protein QXE50_05705 [Nitrososphaerota archaeon]
MSEVQVETTIDPSVALRLARRAASMNRTLKNLQEIRVTFGQKVAQTRIAQLAVDRKSALEAALSQIREGNLEMARVWLEKVDAVSSQIEAARAQLRQLPERERLSELSRRFYKLSIEVAALGEKYADLAEDSE